MLGLTRPLLLAAGLVWASAAGAQETATYSVTEARVLAQSAALQGQPELARRLAAALLREDRQDRTALMVLAAVEPQLGRPAQGRMAGVRAWRESRTPAERFAAARLTAAAASREGRHTQAQLWLRRAAANSPSEEALEQIRRDYDVVRRRNPWNFRLDLSAAPSSNVNGGSSASILTVDGEPVTFFGLVGRVPDEAQALSGWTYSADLRVARRIAASETRRTSLAFRLQGRGVELSQEARESAPNARNEDYASAYADLTLAHQGLAEGGSYGLTATLGAQHYGGDFSYSFLRLGATRGWRTDTGDWSLGASVEQRWDEGGARDEEIYRLDGSHRMSVAAGRLSFGLGLELADGPTGNDRSEAVSLSTAFALTEPLGPAQVSLTAGVEARRYPEFQALVTVPGGREDLRGWAGVSAAFTDWSYAGFAPVVSVEASRTDSNVSNYERSALSVGFSLRSTF